MKQIRDYQQILIKSKKGKKVIKHFNNKKSIYSNFKFECINIYVNNNLKQNLNIQDEQVQTSFQKTSIRLKK